MNKKKLEAADLEVRRARVAMHYALKQSFPSGASVNVIRSGINKNKPLVCHVLGWCGPSDILQATYTTTYHDGYVYVENPRTGSKHHIHWSTLELRT